MDGDWLLGVPPGVEAPDKEVELDDNEPEPEEVELEPVVEEGALVEEPGEMVPLVEVPREEVLEVTLEVPVDVDAVPVPEVENVLLDDGLVRGVPEDTDETLVVVVVVAWVLLVD
ncbi:hypothetical protein CSOJ01_12359 [Colletotrichum sojae]|uniref:Uncharacterized protein n=1 Tax=Colletotrichum sojae TaxID=2175907 RepID=A0A8H6MMH4_9PEZI|nr:hypothetical protein CSOJ01_12359 [Colletotrichum sojae]